MTPGEPIEDYEQLHHTFLGGAGNRHLVITHVEDVPQTPSIIQWWRLALYFPATLFIGGLAILLAKGLVPGWVLMIVGLSLVGLVALLIRRHSIRYMPIGEPKRYVRGQWASPAAARAHASATLYKQRQHAARGRVGR